ncbi:MAG: hypothetical protein L7H10_03980 [Vulcanisaeta sp.]|nr:hypothetical protein [Vulcanisaeta sp.]
MRTGVLVAVVGLVFMVVGFAVLGMTGDALFSASIFIIGFLLDILGILMINRDIENLIVKLEVESNKPSPEDIKRRPLRKPRRG